MFWLLLKEKLLTVSMVRHFNYFHSKRMTDVQIFISGIELQDVLQKYYHFC